jgi:hypothetical protein
MSGRGSCPTQAVSMGCFENLTGIICKSPGGAKYAAGL